MALTLGIDVAVRAAHQATVARDGATVWRGGKFWTRPADLDRMWGDLDLTDPAELTVVLEPTRNAWIVLAEWFRRRGARVVMVPTTQSADLRKYYSKHTKNDRIYSELLSRLPLLHPEGLREYSGQGPADALRRLVKQRSTMVKRRVAVYARLDALVELLGPSWYGVAGVELRHRRIGVPAPLRRPERCNPAWSGPLGQVLDRPLSWCVARGPRRRAGGSREGDPGAVGAGRDEPRRARRGHRPRGRTGHKQAADQESPDSPSAPTSQPANNKPTSRQVA